MLWKIKIVHTRTDCFQVKYHKMYSYNTYENSALNGHLECEILFYQSDYIFNHYTCFRIIDRIKSMSRSKHLQEVQFQLKNQWWKKKGFQIFCIIDCCNIFISDIRETISKNINVFICICGTHLSLIRNITQYTFAKVLSQTDEKKTTKLNILSSV